MAPIVALLFWTVCERMDSTVPTRDDGCDTWKAGWVSQPASREAASAAQSATIRGNWMMFIL